jgi:hypothetical protein
MATERRPLVGEVWSVEQRRSYAIARSIERTRAELVPTRTEMAEHIESLGWRRPKPIIWAALGRPVQRQGLWTLGKRDTIKVLSALRARPGQRTLFDNGDGPEAA